MKGFIIKSIAGDFHVYSEETGKTYVCKARGQIRNLKLQPVCGDEVVFEYDESANFSIITNILERKKDLFEKVRYKRKKQKIIGCKLKWVGKLNITI